MALPGQSQVSLGGLGFALQLTANPTSQVDMASVLGGQSVATLGNYGGQATQITGPLTITNGSPEMFELVFSEGSQFFRIKDRSNAYTWYASEATIVEYITAYQVKFDINKSIASCFIYCTYTDPMSGGEITYELEVSGGRI